MTHHNIPSGIHIKGQGCPVIMLHSSLSSSRQWQPLVSMLEGQCLIINIDILGYGQAEKITDAKAYNFDEELLRINQVIELVIPGEKYHLVGHSCGGALALKMAVEAPDKLLSLSLFEPVAFHLLEKGSVERDESDSFAHRVNIDDKYKAAEIFTNYWNQEGFFKSLPVKMQRLMANDMEKVNLDFQALTAEQYSLDDISNISCRTLLMSGDYSPKLSHDLLALIAGAIPNKKLLTFKVGHMGPVSHSQLIHPEIAGFIQKIISNGC
jgi:pimeloyl-ACP methyl ester carboxylesterase